jgi:glyoxylase-like metal-dependent hydrolase (beta-lactamase superfamily II)
VGRLLEIGSGKLHPLFTPGHTSHHHCFVVDNGTMQMVFSGDALLIDACGNCLRFRLRFGLSRLVGLRQASLGIATG